MTKCLTPACYFPSTAVFVDDSQSFLEGFVLTIDDRYSLRLFDSPNEALRALQLTSYAQNLHERCLTGGDLDDFLLSRAQTLQFDLSAIHSEVYNMQRFAEVSVVVVDYAMPGMNGIELCRALQDLPTRKVLLTGIADEKVAIEAFNAGLIDAYYQKHDLNISFHINEVLRKLQERYFRNLSELIVQTLSHFQNSCLTDARFAEFFQTLCKKHGIVEYYLMEQSGSFLMLDGNANVYCLVVKTERDLQRFHRLAVDNKAPDTVCEQLAAGKAIPFFWQSYGVHEDQWSEWSTYLHPAELFVGTNTYSYALIKDPRPFDVQREKIMSYNEYLANLDEVKAPR